MSSLPASIKKIWSKTTEKRWRHRFSHIKSMGAFCCHGNQSFDLICPKTLCSLSPTPVMLHIKFDLGWPAGFRDIQVWKCGRRRRTDDGPLLYYKLTLWAFGSGELKMAHFKKLLFCQKTFFWYQTSSCKCSMCLYCVGKVLNCFGTSCGTSWIPRICTIYTHVIQNC